LQYGGYLPGGCRGLAASAVELGSFYRGTRAVFLITGKTEETPQETMPKRFFDERRKRERIEQEVHGVVVGTLARA